MIQLSVQVRNAQLVQKRFEDLGAEIPKIGRQQIRTVMNRIVRRMQIYPPEPPGQMRHFLDPTLGWSWLPVKGRYVRTGKLFASWRIDETEDRNGYKVSNNAAHKGRPYARYVVGDAYGQGQAYMHQRGYLGRQGWPLLRDVTEQEIAKLPQEITKSITMVARRRGF